MSNHHFRYKIKLLFTIIAVVSSIYIIGYLYDMSTAKRQSNLLNNISQNLIFNNHDVNNINNSQIGNEQNNVSVDDNDKSLHVENVPKVIEKNERMIKIETLQSKNPDIVGWLEISGTAINYPVLQGTDNDFYVNHNYKKQKTASGSIFIDADYNWNPMSTNLLIYGHNMKNGTMFTSLLNYKSKSYYNAHPNIRFTTNTFDVNYEIIAVFESRVYDKLDTNSFKYYNFINSENEEEFDNFISNVKSISIYDTGKTAKYGDKLMTLSTCAYHTKNGRFAVVARNTKKDLFFYQ